MNWHSATCQRVIDRDGDRVLIQAPKGLGSYTFWHPVKLVKIVGTKPVVRFHDEWTFWMIDASRSEARKVTAHVFLARTDSSPYLHVETPRPLTPIVAEIDDALTH